MEAFCVQASMMAAGNSAVTAVANANSRSYDVPPPGAAHWGQVRYIGSGSAGHRLKQIERAGLTSD